MFHEGRDVDDGRRCPYCGAILTVYFFTDWDIAVDGGRGTTYRIVACVCGGCDYSEYPVLDAEGDI